MDRVETGNGPSSSTNRSSRRSEATTRGDRWLHEIKYDGYRIGCVIDKKARVSSAATARTGRTSSLPSPKAPTR
jgi:ATP-dependent DNA ligase